jgi:aminoglycoside phosphotransferase (APT) family kinase protein
MTDSTIKSLEALRPDIEDHCRRVFSVADAVMVDATPIPSGHSGFTYRVRIMGTGLDKRLVIRIPPPGAQPRGPADVVRQGRIMAGLEAAGVAAPGVPLIVRGEETRSGRPFIAMNEVVADSIDEAIRKQAPDALLAAAVDALRTFQRVPINAVGLDDPPTTLDAELSRWRWLMERTQDDLSQRSEALYRRLAVKHPVERTPCLVHGDYHFGNLLFREASVAAILDWEIAEVGQPLLDFACLAVFALRRRFKGEPNPAGAVAVTAEQVRQLSGVSAVEFGWYVALTCYKYSAILGYNLRLHMTGKRLDLIYEALTGTIYGLLDVGAEVIA